MALKDLINNDPNFNYYYGGPGNFTQKSIPWGTDKSPYIKWPINGEKVSVSGDRLQDVININKNNLDYPIRGGSNRIGSGVAYGAVVPEMSRVDYTRISRFLQDDPKGKIFIDKQVGLQASNPLMESGLQVNLSDNFTSTRYVGETITTRIFNKGRNLLDQIQYNGSGTHIERHGVVPFNAPSSLYSNIVPKKSTNENRLVLLYKTKIVRQNVTSDDLNNLSYLGISTARNLMFDYLGGPKSFYGIGSTTIKRYTDTTDLTNPVKQESLEGQLIGTVNVRNFNYTYNYDQLAEAREIVRYKEQDGPFDFREVVNRDDKTGNGFYRNNNLERKRGLGNPGKRKTSYANYTTVDKDSVDKLNELSLFYSTNEDPWIDPNSRDIIKFGFEAIDNDNINNSLVMLFRAYLDSFVDNHNADFSEAKYVGRGDGLMNYTGFKRDINFSFKIAAQTRSEMEPLYKKLNALASQVYPDYNVDGYMRAPMVKVTVGDYIYRQPGFITNFAIVIEKDFPWEIKMDQDLDGDMQQLPQILSINCNFKPIHNFLPRKISTLDKVKYNLIGNNLDNKIAPLPQLASEQLAVNIIPNTTQS